MPPVAFAFAEIKVHLLICKICKCYSITFLVRHLYLIGMWLGEDQITNTKKTHV